MDEKDTVRLLSNPLPSSKFSLRGFVDCPMAAVINGNGKGTLGVIANKGFSLL
jgi:hypothetical protein